MYTLGPVQGPAEHQNKSRNDGEDRTMSRKCGQTLLVSKQGSDILELVGGPKKDIIRYVGVNRSKRFSKKDTGFLRVDISDESPVFKEMLSPSPPRFVCFSGQNNRQPRGHEVFTEGMWIL